MDSLLVSLQKYSSRPLFNPIENFTTEAFAWLLRNDENSQEAFIDLIYENVNTQDYENVDIKKQIEDSKKSKIDWKTQEYLESGIADIIGRSEHCIFVIEVKVDSAGDKDQLENYTKDLRNHSSLPAIGVLLTSRYSQHYMKANCYLLWEDVYRYLEKKSDINENNEKRKDFMAYLDFKDLSPKPIPYEMWRYTAEFKDYVERGKLAEIFNIIKKEEQNNNTFAKFESQIVENGKWGRIGITFSRHKDSKDSKDPLPDDWWNPALFIGTVFDYYDHRYEELFNKGAFFCMIVSVGINLWELVYKSKEWKDFAKKLSCLDFKELKNYNFKNFLLNVPDSEIVKYSLNKSRKLNAWHTIVIYKPMVDVIKDYQLEHKKEHKNINLKEILKDEIYKLISSILNFSNKEYQDLIKFIDNNKQISKE